jgi:hypothetical protein
VLVHEPHVVEHQVHQTERGVDVHIAVGRARVDVGGIASRLEAALAASGLDDPVVRIVTVDSIDRHPETGKLRRVIALAGATPR